MPNLQRSKRTARSVWNIATEPFPEAHFATFPEELAERCIKAGTSEKGCCSECGKPWERVTERNFIPDGNRQQPQKGSGQKGLDATNGWSETPRGSINFKTIGWQPACSCNAPSQPCVVLDPFAGAGTTVLVADKLGRHGVGLELKPNYCQMARRRVFNDAPLFNL